MFVICAVQLKDALFARHPQTVQTAPADILCQELHVYFVLLK